jgi:hypothetical protein
MAVPKLNQQITNYYLEVQALTPVPSASANPPLTASADNNWLSQTAPTFIIFALLLFIGMVALLITHARNLNKLLIVMGIAFATSMIPLGMRALNQPTQIPSQADASLTPTRVLVGQVTAAGFNLSWVTQAPTLGAVSLKKTSDPNALKQIIFEPGDAKVSSHFLSLQNLQSNTAYEIFILSGGTWYGLADGQPLTVTTSK